MKLLLDQDVYRATVRFLSEQEHDAVTVSQLGRSFVVVTPRGHKVRRLPHA